MRGETRAVDMKDALDLVRALWMFIEDVGPDDPERTDRFFALRQRVREFYEVAS